MMGLFNNSHLGNLALLIFLGFGIWYGARALCTKPLTNGSREMIEAHIFMWVSLAIGYVYWLTGSGDSLEGVQHKYKGIMRAVTSGLFGWGMVKFLTIFEGWTPASRVVHFAGAFVLAYIGTNVFW